VEFGDVLNAALKDKRFPVLFLTESRHRLRARPNEECQNKEVIFSSTGIREKYPVVREVTRGLAGGRLLSRRPIEMVPR
jgi:hypothetical protein